MKMDDETLRSFMSLSRYVPLYVRFLRSFIPLISSCRLVPFRLRRAKGGEWNRRRHDPTGVKVERSGRDASRFTLLPLPLRSGHRPGAPPRLRRTKDTEGE